MKKALIIAIILIFTPLISQATSGCCSWHGGVQGCDTNTGRQVCNDGTYSPSCGCEYIPPPPPPVVYGCMNEFAKNYNPNATTNCCCEFTVYGCKDHKAINFDKNATDDDESCEYKKIESKIEDFYTADEISYDSEMYVNNERIDRESKLGKRKVTYTIIYKKLGGGYIDEISRIVKSSKVTKKPVSKVLVKGTKAYPWGEIVIGGLVVSVLLYGTYQGSKMKKSK